MVENLDNIKRNTNDFSFVETVASLVNNRQWRSGYDFFASGERNDKTYFWECLSAVGEEIGDVIYDNVLNYINNVANINTCKIHALKSIATVLGIKNFAILGNVEQVPLDVLNLIDIFSINRSYLLNVNNFDIDFVKDMFDNTLDQESYESALTILSTVAKQSENGEKVFGLSGFLTNEELSSVFIAAGFDSKKYEDYIEECFFKLLTSKLFQQYGDEKQLSGDLIFLNLSANDDFSVDDSLEYMRNSDSKDLNTPYNKNILWYGDDQKSLYKNNYANYVYRLKKSLNVPLWFNQKLIVDKIENGFDFIDNYSGGELSVLQAEMAERAKTRYSKGVYASTRQTTRYSYYNEIEVKKYIKFVDGMYSLSNYFNEENDHEPYNPYNLANIFSPYGLDNTFSDVTNFSTEYGLLSNINETFSVWKDSDVDVDLSSRNLSNFICNYYSDYRYVISDDSGKICRNEVRTIAKILKDICLAIVDIRERLKTQSQRNYMIGTKLLIEYILNEYLVNALVKNYGVDPKKAMDSFGAMLIEYNDTTEYFNIGQMQKDMAIDTTINMPYWNSLSSNPFNGQQGGNGIPEELVKAFYLSTLNIKNESWKNCISDDTYYDFMSAVYDLGKTESYYSLDKGLLVTNKERFLEGAALNLDENALMSVYNLSKPEISAIQSVFLISSEQGFLSINYNALSSYIEVLSGNLAELSNKIDTYNSRLSICYAQQEEIVLKYHGADIFYYPWYNYKNTVYPTYQTHPYMYNFIEHADVSFPIENAFYGNANEDLIMELQSKSISVYLEQFGNVVRVWRNSNFDYSGYKSRYEASTHNVNVFSNPNRLYSVTHYDGTFYPPALTLYKKYLNEELNKSSQEAHEVVGWERLSTDLLCTNLMDDSVDVETQDVSTISNMWFYYSHLNLTYNDRLRIYEQLTKLSAYILDVSTDDKYDIYQYGLDIDLDSFVLYKQYDDGVLSFSEKQNALGQLWIRFNNHPIGFPAFIVDKDLSAYGQFNWENAYKNDSKGLNDSLQSYVFNEDYNDGELKSPKIFYNFDFAANGEYLVLATKNRNLQFPNYKYPILFAGRISQYRYVDYQHMEREQTFFNLLAYENECMYPSNEIDFSKFTQTDYEFLGFFQNNYTLYAGYVKRHLSGDELTAIELNAIEYPASRVQSKNQDSFNFAFSTSWKQVLLNRNDVSSLSTDKNANIALGYSDFDETFSLVVQQKILEDNPLIVQDFTAYQTTDGISGYGKTDVLFGTIDDGENKTSFDRFSDYLTIYDIEKSKILKREGHSIPLVYGLNADASWIPLYPGISGQNLQYKMLNGNERISYNRAWHDLSVAKESIELLGHSYNALADKCNVFESTIIVDEETKKLTNYDPNSALDAFLRVYEDFNREDYVFDAYSQAASFDSESHNQISSKVPASSDAKIDIEFTISGAIESSLSSYTIDSLSSQNLFRVLLLNSMNGKTANPVLAGNFCKETFDHPRYDSESTYEEEYILSTNGYRLGNVAYIVGTQNPFDPRNKVYEINYSNHLFNISAISTELQKKDGHFVVKLSLQVKYDFAFVIPTMQFRLFVYKSSLEEFEKYHYMEPFGHFPYNAAVSSWSKVPWKDIRYPFLYDGGILSSDKWFGRSDYLDKRNSSKSHIDELSVNGASDYNLVGNMLLSNDTSFYDVSVVDSQISLMERIDLKSIGSFDEQYFLSTGQITFKISEDSRFNSLRSKYPPASIDQLLWSLFSDTNTKHYSNTVFDLSNTYIFQLEDPDRIAKLIGKIGIPIYEISEDAVFVFEDSLSDYINTDINGNDAINEYEILDVPRNAEKYYPIDEDIPVSSHSFADYQIDDSKSFEENLIALSECGGYLHKVESKSGKGSPYDYILTSVTGEDISDYLKIYANWRYFEDGNGKNEIELFFNIQNLFNSPYHYRTEEGSYAIEFKPTTYLRLKSGENGYLNIVFQLKYFDVDKNLIGMRDIPILTYRIYNISDDKPKFLLTKTYEIDNLDEKNTYSSENNVVYIVLETKRYGYDVLDRYIDWNYTFVDDFLANVNMEVLSPIPMKSLSVEFMYERGTMQNQEIGEEEPELVFETNQRLSTPGKFEDHFGMVLGDIEDNVDVNLAFSLLRGATIDRHIREKFFPIELINANGIDIYGNTPKFVFVNGGIDFTINADHDQNKLLPGLYLGRETNIVSASSI